MPDTSQDTPARARPAAPSRLAAHDPAHRAFFLKTLGLLSGAWKLPQSHGNDTHFHLPRPMNPSRWDFWSFEIDTNL